MKQEQEHIKTYSARDIQQYLEGKLSSAEMHAIEKAALDDPFLADAIEGYAVLNEKQQNSDLHSLRTGLEKRINKEKKKAFLIPTWMRAAMIVLAVSVSGLAIYKLYNANTEAQTNPIAKNETVRPAEERDHKDKAAADSITVNEQTKIDSQSAAQVEIRQFKKEGEKAIAKKPVPAAPTAPAATKEPVVATLSEPAAAAKKETADQLEQKSARSAASNTESLQKIAEARSLQQNQVMNAFSGKVLDSKNKPVAGATIITTNRRQSAVTDMNGYFNISAPDTALNIEVNSVGYQQNNATLRYDRKTPNNIVLQESNAALDEVVVVGYGAKGKKSTRIQKPDSVQMKEMEEVEPLEGWDEYDTYISSNIRRPTGFEDIDGEVILSFEVNEKHEISNIKVIKSLSQDLDKEAIRLIKEGPQWKPKKGRKGKGKLAIKF